MCVCVCVRLTLERLVSATTRRGVVSLVVAARWGGVAEVPSAVACVQTVTASREEAISPPRQPRRPVLSSTTSWVAVLETR